MNLEINFTKNYDQILELAKDIYSEFDYYWFSYWIRRTRLIEVKLDKAIVGFSQIFITNTFCGKSGVILYIAILENYRRKGLGTITINWIEDYFKFKNCEIIFATTRIENKPAIFFFKKLNYKVLYLDCIINRIKEGFDLIRKLNAYDDDILFFKKLRNKNTILDNLEECFFKEIQE